MGDFRVSLELVSALFFVLGRDVNSPEEDAGSSMQVS